MISAGKHLWIFLVLAVILLVGAGLAEASPRAADPGSIVYTVQPGDTLFSIARRHGTTVAAIAQINGILDPTMIYVGQRLVIPAQPSEVGPYSRYTVKAGDTLFSIAARHGTTVAAIAQVNKILNPALIYVGQVLLIPQEGSTPPPGPPVQVVEYVVQPGDNLTRIAVRFGTTSWAIALTNNLANPSLIYAGQRLVIPITGQIAPASAYMLPSPVPATAPPTQIIIEPPPEAPCPTCPAEPALFSPDVAPPATGYQEAPVVVSEPSWRARVTSNTSGEVPTQEIRSVLRVSVVGQKGLQVVVSSKEGSWQAANLTGTKPEYGEWACEFAPLSAGTYVVAPKGLGIDVSIDVTLDGVGIAYVEFAQW